MVLFHLFEYLIDEREYYRTSFNHDMELGPLLLNVQSSLTVSSSIRPGVVMLQCSNDYSMAIGYVFVLVNFLTALL